MKACGACLVRQYMAGGDLCTALQRDMVQSERGGRRRLGWYGRGCNILVGVARGLAYLHEQRARAGWSSCSSHDTGPVCALGIA